jgi:hypothetical protein
MVNNRIIALIIAARGLAIAAVILSAPLTR